MVGLDKFNDLLQQDVTRKEFLHYLGIALLSLIGVASMLQNLNSAVNTSTTKDTQNSGYSAGPYGR
ncbi:hypothetical protein H0X10_00460 [Candidatus Saccharibacteria bacterium]|nr:hypothetical protein [Candidatus Saccharibacteria bacterium]